MCSRGAMAQKRSPNVSVLYTSCLRLRAFDFQNENLMNTYYKIAAHLLFKVSGNLFSAIKSMERVGWHVQQGPVVAGRV
jgi:hypothetical protein